MQSCCMAGIVKPLQSARSALKAPSVLRRRGTARENTAAGHKPAAVPAVHGSDHLHERGLCGPLRATLVCTLRGSEAQMHTASLQGVVAAQGSHEQILQHPQVKLQPMQNPVPQTPVSQ